MRASEEVTSWQYCDDLQRKFPHVIASIERECRERDPGEADRTEKALISDNTDEYDAEREEIKLVYPVRICLCIVAQGACAVTIISSTI